MNRILRLDEISPIMRAVISGYQQNYSTRIEEVLSKGTLAYMLMEFIEAQEAGRLGEMLPLDSDSLAKISNFLSHDSERSQKAEAEFQEIDKMLKKITFEFGKFQLQQSTELQRISQVCLRTKGKVNIILGSDWDDDLLQALA